MAEEMDSVVLAVAVAADGVLCPECGNPLPVGINAFCDCCGAPLFAAFYNLPHFISRPESVAARVMALEEPWRTRFLEYIGSVRNSRKPESVEELTACLAEDPALCNHIRLLLCAWTKR